MGMNARFAEQFQLVSGVPLDTQGAAGLATPYVSLEGWGKAAIVYIGAAGTGTDAAVISPLQATAVAGTSEKALNVTAYSVKSGADLKTVGAFTNTTQAAGATVTGGVATEQKCVVVDIDPASLDVDGGFDCLKATVADTGAAGAQLGVLFLILWQPRYTGAAAPTALGN